MRLDKFLKVSRLIKRRTLAKEICDAGRVSINGRTAKASADVNVGDTLIIRYGQKTVEVRVLKVLENPTKEMASQLYEMISEESVARVEPQFVDDETN